MNNIIITIARQYGSGGRTVGKLLSQELKITYYDKDLLTLASDDSGINKSLFAKSNEKIKNQKVFRIDNNIYHGELISPDEKDFTSEDNLFNYQAKIIRQLAQEESCIIIGRSADYVLKEHPNVLSVFIHAPLDFCLKEAAKKHNLSNKELEKYITKIDKDRADYYRYHTGREWIDARNYDLCLDSSKFGFDKCVKEIKDYITVRFQ